MTLCSILYGRVIVIKTLIYENGAFHISLPGVSLCPSGGWIVPRPFPTLPGQVRAQDSSLGAKTQGPKIEAEGRERGGLLWEGAD